MKPLPLVLMLAVVATLPACSRDMSDLEQYVAEVKSRRSGRIDPLPQIKPYETFVYSADDLRSPFQAEVEAGVGTPSSTIRPKENRPPEYLEQFSLDTMRMVGTLNLEGTVFALLQTNDGLLHRVSKGNYVGQNEGEIVEVSPSEIRLVEIVPDGLGGYLERPAAIALTE